MRLGGTERLAARLGGVPTGLGLDLVFRLLAGALRSMQGGIARTVTIVQGDLNSEEVIRQGLQSGAPGYLLGYLGATYDRKSLDGAHHERILSMGVLAIAESYYGQDDRVAGMTGNRPSLFQLLGWAAFYGGRALHRIEAFRGTARPTSERILGATAEHALGLLTFEARTELDLLEDMPYGLTLEKAGIVHTPKAREPLFTEDNLTPNTLDPTSLPGPGVASLVE